MAKKYTRKNVSSLAELDLEQERIRYKMNRIEDGLLDLFNPQQLAIAVIGKLLSRKRKENAGARYITSSRLQQPKKKQAKAAVAGDKIRSFLSHPPVKRIVKKAGISFLQWQAFNLALFLGKKLFRKIKDQRAERKLIPSTGK